MQTSHKIAVGLVVIALIFVGFRVVGHYSGQHTEQSTQQVTEQTTVQTAAPAAAPNRVPGGGVFPGVGSEKDWQDARAIAKESANAIRAHDFDQALTLGEQAIAKYPNDPDFQNNTAYAYILRDQPGDGAKAEPLLRQALALNPNSPLYWDNLARSLAAQNKMADARAAFAKALECNPSPQQASEIEQNIKQIDAASQPAAQQ